MNLTRRTAPATAGIAGAATALGQGTAFAADASSIASPGEEGLLFVDVKLDRRDIRSDADGTDVQPGIPLSLTLQLDQATAGTPCMGATVTDASGSHAGTRSVKLRLSNGVGAGRATLKLTITDPAGSTKIARRILTIPKA